MHPGNRRSEVRNPIAPFREGILVFFAYPPGELGGIIHWEKISNKKIIIISIQSQLYTQMFINLIKSILIHKYNTKYDDKQLTVGFSLSLSIL